MAYDQELSEKLKNTAIKMNIYHHTKNMFGGLCFMVDDKMCFGIVKDKLMVRVDPDEYEELFKEKGASVMDFTKRPMKGYLNISDEGLQSNEQLEFWIQKCLDYNPKAKSSKKK